MICPYCQSNIKRNADKVLCPLCSTPHHKECWEDNGGCTTYGCRNNPGKGDNETQEYVDVGSLTVEEINKQIEKEERLLIKTATCPNCRNPVDDESVFCNTCGYKLKEIDTEEKQNEFEKEFQRRYKEKTIFNRRRKYFLFGSMAVIMGLLIVTLFVAYNAVKGYYNSDEYSINRFLKYWELTWERKNIEAYKNLLTGDYQYLEKDKKPVDYDERIRRMAYTFENYKYIKLQIKDVNIRLDTASWNYANVTFRQSYISDKVEETGTKTLRLYRGEDSGFKWKISREYFD